MKSLIISVIDIMGNCPICEIEDKIVIGEGYKINLSKTTASCMHSLASIILHYVPLSNSVNPKSLGLSKIESDEKSAFIQCLVPCKCTSGRTVVFKLELKNNKLRYLL